MVKNKKKKRCEERRRGGAENREREREVRALRRKAKER
jgi:hypothetical protein